MKFKENWHLNIKGQTNWSKGTSYSSAGYEREMLAFTIFDILNLLGNIVNSNLFQNYHCCMVHYGTSSIGRCFVKWVWTRSIYFILVHW